MKYPKNFRSILLLSLAIAVVGTAVAAVVILQHPGKNTPTVAVKAVKAEHTANKNKKAESKPAAPQETPASTGTPAATSSQAASPAPAPAAASPAPQPNRDLHSWKPTYDQPLRVTQVTLTRGAQVCGAGVQTFGYTYTIEFNANNVGGEIGDHWEYMGDPGSSQPEYQSVYDTPLAPNTSKIINTVNTAPRGFQVLGPTYKARLHVTVPNDIYSNWITLSPEPKC